MKQWRISAWISTDDYAEAEELFDRIMNVTGDFDPDGTYSSTVAMEPWSEELLERESQPLT